MPGFGPPPKPASQRRHRGKTLSDAKVTLPASGRTGDAPAWPIGRATKAQAALWEQLWSTPQAVAWESSGWTRAVARYTRLVLEAEKPGAPSSLLAEVRQMEDRLGLTPMALLRLRWEIVDDSRADLAPVAQVADYRAALGG